MSMQENGKRRDVFMALVEQGETMTPSEIGDEVDETRQIVKYHLDKMVDSGLVVQKVDGYRCQEVFTDDALEEEFVELFSEFVPAVAERIDVEDVGGLKFSHVVFNNIRAFIALEVIGPGDGDDE